MGEEEFAEAGNRTRLAAARWPLDEGQPVPPTLRDCLVLIRIEILLVLEHYFSSGIDPNCVGLSPEVFDDMLALGKLLHLVLIVVG